jgi:DNA-binding response OmpR family regulator
MSRFWARRPGRAQLARGRPALILLDVMMPEMDGYTVAQLRAQFVTSQIPIIMLRRRTRSTTSSRGSRSGERLRDEAVRRGRALARIRTVLRWSKEQRSANP